MIESRRRRITGRADFLAFYDSTFRDAYRYAGRLCGRDREAAEDLVQDAYTAVLRRVQQGDKPELHVGYLITAIRNRHLDRIKREGREQRRLRLVHSGHPDTDGADGADHEAVMSELACLPERDRTALVLRYVDCLSVPAVADAMGLSVHATESVLARARARLRRKDANHG